MSHQNLFLYNNMYNLRIQLKFNQITYFPSLTLFNDNFEETVYRHFRIINRVMVAELVF